MRKALGLLLALALLLSLLPAALAAESDDTLPAASDASLFTPVRVYVDGLLSARGFVDAEGRPWLALTDLCRLCGLDVRCRWDGAVFTAEGKDFSLRFCPQDGYLTLNGRYVYCPEGMEVLRGKPYFPAAVIAKLFTLGMALAEDVSRLDLDASALAVIRGTKYYYADTFGKDEFYWLCRVISSESGGEPLEGQIAVGNVVLHRVADEHFPDSVYGVIFDDPGDIVQFEVTANGTVYDEPRPLSVVAAALVVEGYETAPRCLYFLNPYAASNAWFRATRTYEMTINNHEFYS